MMAVVTRAVSKDEPSNCLRRAVSKGERFYVFTGATYGVISANGIALSEYGETAHPFFEFPADAVDQVQS